LESHVGCKAMENGKKFKVYRAGAGSGKTFQLIREFLSLALSQPKEDYYRHILAITFTNAAAHEMRHRFLKALRQFAGEKESVLLKDPLFEQVLAHCGIAPHELQQRAALTYRHVLHHYDQLAISTIDSYAQKLVRSFAFELNLAGDFQLELDTEDFYDRVISACLDEVGIDPELTRYLLALVESRLDDQQSWKAKPVLAQYATYLKSDRGNEVALEMMERPDDFFLEARKIAAAHVHRIRQQRKQLVQDAMEVLHRYSSDESDYAGKSRGYANVLKRIGKTGLTDNVNPIQKAYTEQKYFTKESGLQLSPEDLSALTHCFGQLQDSLNGKVRGQELIYDQISRNILGLGVLKQVAEKAQMIRSEEHLLLIDDLHQRVHEVLCEQSSPFLFERLGVRYKHIMIDEFQDTSTKQWSNMLPLFSNALSEGHDTMLVGDAKQSIYRFRGGNARQFVELPELPSTHLDANEASQFAFNFNEQLLQCNRRSDAQIVRFNNALYQRLAGQLSGMQSVYKDVEQEWTNDVEGWVTAQQTENSTMAKQAVYWVKDALKRNYLPSDIAVLVLKKNQGYMVTQELARHGIRVQSEESLLLIHSHKVAFLEAWLSYIEMPMQQDKILAMVAQLERAGMDIQLMNFCERAQQSDQPISAVLQDMVAALIPELFESILDDVYDEAVRVLACMRWPMDGQVEFFLNELFQKSKVETWSRSKWNTWWAEKRDSMSMKVGADPMAVRIMTVHKSKGLEFPVVVFCLLSRQKEQSDWFNLPPNECSVPALYMGVKRPSAKVTYTNLDDVLEEQNQKYLEELELEGLNVRYVATTRPRNELHLLIEESTQRAYWNAIVSVDGGQQEAEWLSWGKSRIAEPRVTNLEKQEAPVYLDQVETKSREGVEIRTEQQRWGEFLHECLAHIRESRDVQKAVDRMYIPHRHASWMTKEEIVTNLQKLIAQGQVRPWFEGWQEVWIERDIITARGELLRPDRVIRTADTITIVDYKTGAQEVKHAAQLRTYASELAKMYPNDRITAWLWYISENTIEGVTLDEL
jgi:ATP-dependent exoDNAse (exonuclease V) beta subunit